MNAFLNLLFITSLMLALSCRKDSDRDKEVVLNNEVCLSEVGCGEVTATSQNLSTLTAFTTVGTEFYAVTAGTGDSLYLNGAATSGGTSDAYILKFDMGTEAVDPLFGTNGAIIVNQTFAQYFNGAFLDGNLIYGYGQDNAPSSGGQSDGLLRRFDATTGAIDTSFNSTGKIVQAYSGNWYDSTYHATKLSDNKIYACGYFYRSGANGYDAFITRYTAAGALDTTFGTSGHLYISFPGNKLEGCYKVLELPNGQILVYGIYNQTAGVVDYLPWIQRYNSDWTLDTTFAASGTLKINYSIFAFTPATNNVLLDGDDLYLGGNIVATNGDPTQAAIVKVDINQGTIDTSFGANGMLLLEPACNAGDKSNIAGFKILDKSLLIRGTCASATKSVGFIVPVLNTGDIDPLFNNGKSYYYLGDPSLDSYSTTIGFKLSTSGMKIFTFDLGVMKSYDLKW